MNPSLANYLTERQFNTLCRYWKTIERLREKASWPLRYVSFDEYDDYAMDAEEMELRMAHNKKIRDSHKRTLGRLAYFEQEYDNYVVQQLGYQFNDGSQDEALFQLLNNGILL